MTSFDQIESLIVKLGDWACEEQKGIFRDYKEDGSVLTKADTTINEQVANLLKKLFPEANVVTEEALFPYAESAPYTFILDPIDGTDAYSQGSPAWCVSLGILDENKKICGGMVYAPRWGRARAEGLMLRRDPNKNLLLNGKKHTNRIENKNLEQFSMPSHTHHFIAFKPHNAKVRSFGSNILHMISPLLYPNTQGGISINCFVWDIAGSHALIDADGFEISYHDGSPFIYTEDLLKERKQIKKILTYGTKEALPTIQNLVNDAYYNYLNQ